MSLEQQVVRLQALLEATRLIHSTLPANEVLTQAAHILVRELELEGALFLDPRSGQIMVTYGEVPAAPWETCPAISSLFQKPASARGTDDYNHGRGKLFSL